jgi:MFS family permease
VDAGIEEKQVLTVTSAAHLLAHLYELAFPAIALTIQEDLGGSLGEALRLSFTMYLLFGLGALPMGLVTDRWGVRSTLTVSTLGAGLAALLVSLASGRAQIVGALALVGLCTSAYHPAGMALLSRTMRERGRALAVNGVFGNLGSALGPFVGGWLAWALGWRRAYAVLGALGIAIGLAALFVALPASRREPAATRPAGSSARATVGLFGLLCVAVLFAGFAYRGTSLVLPGAFRAQAGLFADWLSKIDLERLSGVRNLAAALLASVVYAVGMLGQLLGGHLADRYDLRRAYLGFHLASLPFLVAMAFARDLALVGAACGYFFFALGMQPIENSLVARLTPDRWRSTGYGIKFVLTFGVGSTAVFAVTALQRDGAFAPVFLLCAAAIACLCLAVGALLLSSRGSEVRNTRPAPAAPLA